MNIVLDEGAFMPEQAHKGDAGFDLRTPERVIVYPHDSVIIDTGVHVQIPFGYVGMLKSKSGLNVKHGLSGEGVIDSGYTGSIVAKIYNKSTSMHEFKKGDKVIQLVLLPVYSPELTVVDSLDDTDRGDNGFGSSGR